MRTKSKIIGTVGVAYGIAVISLSMAPGQYPVTIREFLLLKLIDRNYADLIREYKLGSCGSGGDDRGVLDYVEILW